MAVMTGKFPGGCCTDIRHYSDRIECAPQVSPGLLKSGMTNSHHEWRCLLWGEEGEKVHIVLHWPPFDPDKVDKSANEYWFVESFAGVAADIVFTGTDELTWTRLEEGVRRDGWDFHIDVTLPAGGKLYVSVNLPFTLKALDRICEEFKDYRFRLGKTAGGLDIPAFRFGTGKRAIWLQANQHVTEIGGCYVLWSLMRELVKPETDLRDFSFFVVPSVSVDKMIGDGTYPEYKENINRDWLEFRQPETKAISDYIRSLTEDGYTMLVMTDMHNGWCRPEDSGGNITEYNHGFIDNEYWERRVKYTRAVLAALDYENPEKIWWHDRPVPRTFERYGSETYRAYCSTYEFSRFQLWDREKGAYVPLSQEGLMRIGVQYAKFLLRYDF